MANVIRDAINMVAEGKDPRKVAAGLVAEAAMGDLAADIEEVVNTLASDGKVQVSVNGDKIIYIEVLGTVFKASPKDTAFTALGSARDRDNVIERDLNSLLTTQEDLSNFQVEDSTQSLKSMANSGAKESLAAICKKRCSDKQDVYDVFKDVLGLSREDTEAAFTPDEWESFT